MQRFVAAVHFVFCLNPEQCCNLSLAFDSSTPTHTHIAICIALADSCQYTALINSRSTAVLVIWNVYIWCFMFTVPAQFSSKLCNFSSEGLRVLALAYKPLDKNTHLRTIERWEPTLYFWLVCGSKAPSDFFSPPASEACIKCSHTEMDA